MAGEKKITSRQLVDLLGPVSRNDRAKILAEALEIQQRDEALEKEYDKYVWSLRSSDRGPAGTPVTFSEWKSWKNQVEQERPPWDIGRGTVLQDPPRAPSGLMAGGMYDVGIEPTTVQRAATGLPQKTGVDLITDEQIEALGARAPVPDDMWSDPNISDQRKLEEARKQSMADAIEVLAGRVRARAR